MMAGRTIRVTKSAVSILVSASLVAVSGGLPASSAWAQVSRAGVASEAGVPAIRAFGVSPIGGSLLPVSSLVASPLATALPQSFAVAPAAVSAASVARAIVVPASARARVVSAASESRDPQGSKRAGPRWTESDAAGKSADRKSGVLGWLGRLFDGSSSRQEPSAAAPIAGQESSPRSALTKTSAREAVIEDHSIPTPEAARRVGAMDAAKPLPLWVKVVAPVSLAAAGVAAFAFGAVPVLTLAAGLVLSVLAHEVAHIAVLHRLGDKTAEHAHSHSLNPLKHIDAVKTVIVPSLALALSSALLPFPILIGAAKPVKADFNNVRGALGGPRSARNAFWVAAAGPLTNLALAGLAFGAAALLPVGGVFAGVVLGLAKMNLALTVFNLIPLPQLDGGKMLASILPESLYTKWIFNPKVEKGYQGVLRRLYEGPSNLLTWIADRLGVRTQSGVNRLANAATFTALAAFYAVAYAHFSVAIPLLFLALPCSYDYWCIREKVRSEAAVQDLMEIMSQWSAVIVQISEDLGLDSEVSAYETEHAMKNALETLVDEMMAKEDFRALSDEAKLEAFLKAYPDKAAEFLKEKAMPEDSIEKIKAVLADPRNSPFYERLKKWFNEHEIFGRWDNKHQQGKLKDAMKEADKGRTQSGGKVGGANLGLVVSLLALGAGVAAFLPGLIPHATALLGAIGMIGALRPGRGDGMGKVSADVAMETGSVVVHFATTATQQDIERALRGLESRPAAPVATNFIYIVATGNGSVGAARAARRVARDPAVLRVIVHPDAREHMNLPVPEPVGPSAAVRPWSAKIKSGTGFPVAKVRVVYASPLAARRDHGNVPGDRTLRNNAVETILRSPAEAAEFARAAAEQGDVRLVVVSGQVAGLLHRGRSVEPSDAPAAPEERAVEQTRQNELPFDGVVPEAPVEEAAPAPVAETPAPVAETPPAKTLPSKAVSNGKEDWSTTMIEVHFEPQLSKEEIEAIADSMGVTGYRFAQPNYFYMTSLEKTEEVVRALDADARVTAIKVHPNAAAFMKGEEAVYADAKSYDHMRALLIQLPEGTSEADAREYAETRRLSFISHAFRGKAGLLAVEVPAKADFTDTTMALVDEALLSNPAVSSLQPMMERGAVMIARPLDGWAGGLKFARDETLSDKTVVVSLSQGVDRVEAQRLIDSVEAGTPEIVQRDGVLVLTYAAPDAWEAGRIATRLATREGVSRIALSPRVHYIAGGQPASDAAAASAETEAAAIPRRDPAQAWVEYLQGVTLNDGKSKLTDKQVQLLATLLKPIAKAPSDARAPIVGRTEEVKRALPIITSPRGMRNSIILVGEAGVGKTAVAEGLAEMAEQAEHASAVGESSHLDFRRLKGRWLVELDVNAVLSAEDPVGLLNAVLDLLPRLNEPNPSAGNKVIVLMDELQKFFLDPNGTKIANILKGPLRDGKVSVIAATTDKEYKQFIEKDDAFRRRFERIVVEEPTVEQTTRMLRAMKGWLEKLHDAVIPDSALSDAAKLADQFDKTNFNPDKAIKAVQDAAELSRPENLRSAISLDIRETWSELAVAFNEARQLLIDKGIPSTLALPAEHWNKIAGLIEKAVALYAERDGVVDGKGKVTTDVVKRVISLKTGIASGQLNLGEEDAARYAKMEEEISRRVVNQEPALTAIANAIRRNKAGLSNPSRPMGKFLLAGPTGVGKTYLAKELARFLFNDPSAMVRFDMSEFMEEHAAMRLVGAPPSYVGYGEGGQLTEAVRKKPYSVILFDEVEKAHPKVFDMLLQILDDGRLTDGEGRTIDFKNTVIIMTSNAGMSGVDGEKYAKLLAKVEDHNQRAEIEKTWDEEIDLMVAESLKSRFRPEFLNRLDEDPRSKNKWIRVNRLRQQDVGKIAEIQLGEFAQILAERHDTDITFDKSVVEFLRVEGFSPLYGARPMTAAIEKHIVDPLAQWILAEAASGKKDVRGGRIGVTVENGKISFLASPKPAKNVTRLSMKGASETVAAEVFGLLESLVGEGQGEEPTESLFDGMLRQAAPKPAASASSEAPTAVRTRAFLAPGASLSAGAVVAGEHNNSKKKDGALRGVIAGAVASVKSAGWDAATLEAVDAPANGQGEGWLKQLVRLAKEQATTAGASAPVSLAASVDEKTIRFAVSGAYAMSEADQRSMLAHFSGTPPASYLEAQRKADNLNLTSNMLWDHNLLDLYRRLSAIPGARMGFKTGPEGTQIWLEIVRGAPVTPVAPAAKVVSAAGPIGVGSPHQQREMAKVRELMMRVIDQSRLKENERDGHAIRIAAAEGYAMLAQSSDAAIAREWIRQKGWAGEIVETREENEWGSGTTSVSNAVGAQWPLAMTAALILERFGGAEDVPLLESMARRVTGTSHFEVPVHNALVSALSAIYARLGLSETRKAMVRASQIKGGRTTDIAEAVKRALGTVGMPSEYGDLKDDADGYLAMSKRLGKTDELLRVFLETSSFGAAGEGVRQAALKLAGETLSGDEVLHRLKNMIRTTTSYSRTGYETSRAWAAIVAREGRTQGLGDAIKRYLDERGVKDYSMGTTWPVLLAYVEAARLAGGAAELGALEDLMNASPNDIASVNEQAYFSSPDAWARSLVRSGLFDEYSRPQGLGEDGAPKPSKLQLMLANQTRPMLVAAALRAIAYARDPSFVKTPIAARAAVPDLRIWGPTSAASEASPSALAAWKAEMLERRFDRNSWQGH